jgi:hypothetical protein
LQAPFSAVDSAISAMCAKVAWRSELNFCEAASKFE